METQVQAQRATDVLADIERALTQLLRRGNQPKVYERLSAETGVQLDRAAYAVICRLDACGPVRVSELAGLLAVDASTASRQVAQLEQAELVTRALDPVDRRAAVVRLTGKGEQVLGKVRAARRAGLGKLLAGWSEEDRRQLATLLARMVHEIELSTGERL